MSYAGEVVESRQLQCLRRKRTDFFTGKISFRSRPSKRRRCVVRLTCTSGGAHGRLAAMFLAIRRRRCRNGSARSTSGTRFVARPYRSRAVTRLVAPRCQWSYSHLGCAGFRRGDQLVRALRTLSSGLAFANMEVTSTGCVRLPFAGRC